MVEWAVMLVFRYSNWKFRNDCGLHVSCVANIIELNHRVIIVAVLQPGQSERLKKKSRSMWWVVLVKKGIHAGSNVPAGCDWLWGKGVVHEIDRCIKGVFGKDVSAVSEKGGETPWNRVHPSVQHNCILFVTSVLAEIVYVCIGLYHWCEWDRNKYCSVEAWHWLLRDGWGRKLLGQQLGWKGMESKEG